jgi:hypothetical protein
METRKFPISAGILFGLGLGGDKGDRRSASSNVIPGN